EIDFVKRRGPQRDAPLFLPLSSNLMQTHIPRHAPVDRPVTAPAPAGSIQSQLVH
ncbi:cell division protein, partial [Massilia norwichensis]|nr:cell division protein [Massilia norwichensis]